MQGDARKIPLADKSMYCVVTSPPYWGLRDYGTAKWVGGVSDCDHRRFSYPPGAETPGGRGGSMPMTEKPFTDRCGKCAALRVDSQIGLERTPEEYIAAMLEVFREVKRVLRDDGTLWLNMGDCYHSPDRGGYQSSRTTAEDSLQRSNLAGDFPGAPNRMPQKGLKHKDLVGMPWRLAFALQADGWYLRSDIIWSKPNPMPESVTDRPTKAHEYIFLLSKGERYFYDADAIKEDCLKTGTPKHLLGGDGARAGNREGLRPSKKRGEFQGKTLAIAGREAFRACLPERNKRSVWTVGVQPFMEAHFATFPEELIKPCILAGCPAGGTVLDPFIGSGTTALVARNLQCNCVGLELNAAYIEIARNRLAQEVLEFA